MQTLSERITRARASMEHLIEVSVATEIHLEWLGTGRRLAHGALTTLAWIPASNARDQIEVQCLRAIRNMPTKLHENLIHMLA